MTGLTHKQWKIEPLRTQRTRRNPGLRGFLRKSYMNTKLVEFIAQIILSLSEEERQLLETKITDAAPSLKVTESIQQDILDLEHRLKTFEAQYNMSSSSFYQQFQAGKLGDAMDFFEWSVFYEMWDNTQKQLAPTQS